MRIFVQNILIFVTETLKMTQRAEAYHQIILYFSECGFRKLSKPKYYPNLTFYCIEYQ